MRLLVLIFLITFLFPKEVIAILDLDAKGLSKEEAEILSGRLTSELINLEQYEIVERAQMFKVLDEQKFQHSGCTDSECAVEIGQMLNADFIVIGNVSKFGSAYSIDARLINAESGSALTSAKFTHKGDIEVLLDRGIISIAKQLMGIKEDNKSTKNKIITNRQEIFSSTDLFFIHPTANIPERGNLFIKQLSSIEFSLNNKLSINSDVIRFIRGDSNFQFKYQIANFVKGEKQKKIAIGMGYSFKSNLGYPYNSRIWQEGSVEVPLYKGQYIECNNQQNIESKMNCTSLDFSWNIFDDQSNDGKVWEQTGPDQTQILYWGGYYTPGAQMEIIEQYEDFPSDYNSDNTYNNDGNTSDDGNKMFSSAPTYELTMDTTFNHPPYLGYPMFEFFAAHTSSIAKRNVEGGFTDYTIGAIIKAIDMPEEVLFLPRFYYGINTDFNQKAKLFFMIFYDSNYSIFSEMFNHNKPFRYGAEDSSTGVYDNNSSREFDEFSSSKITQKSLNPIHINFGFTFKLKPRKGAFRNVDNLRILLHVHQPFLGIYWKL